MGRRPERPRRATARDLTGTATVGIVQGVERRDFDDWVAQDGFGEPTPKTWEAGDKPPLHGHEFDARVLVLEGELSMVYADRVDVLQAGDTCDVPAGTPHSEQPGNVSAHGLLAVRPTDSD